MGWQDAPVVSDKPAWMDAPVISSSTKEPSAAAQWGSALVRPLAKGVAALPLMAMDAGVAARNIAGDVANKVTGRPATPDYTLPSEMFNQALDAYTVAPTGIGKAAEFVSSSLVGGKLGVPEVPAVPKAVAPAVAAAREQGYVVPPTQAGGGLLSKIAEGVSGKVKTQQVASLKNQGVTNSLVRRALGIKADEPITVDALSRVRAQAGKAYEAVREVPGIRTDETYERELAAIGKRYGSTGEHAFGRSEENPVNALVGRLQAVHSFTGDDAVDEIGLLRDEAEKAFGQRDKALGNALRRAAGAIEDQIDRHLSTSKESPALVNSFRNARQMIARTYTVQKALDKATGDVNAQKLAAQLEAEKPLSGDLKTVAKFGGSFGKSAQLPSKVGSVTHFSPLDVAVMGMEGASGLTAAIASGNYKAAAAAAGAMALQAARPAVRAALLSKTGQKLAIEGTPQAAAAATRLTLAGLEQSSTQ